MLIYLLADLRFLQAAYKGQGGNLMKKKCIKPCVDRFGGGVSLTYFWFFFDNDLTFNIVMKGADACQGQCAYRHLRLQS